MDWLASLFSRFARHKPLTDATDNVIEADGTPCSPRITAVSTKLRPESPVQDDQLDYQGGVAMELDSRLEALHTGIKVSIPATLIADTPLTAVLPQPGVTTAEGNDGPLRPAPDTTPHLFAPLNLNCTTRGGCTIVTGTGTSEIPPESTIPVSLAPRMDPARRQACLEPLPGESFCPALSTLAGKAPGPLESNKILRKFLDEHVDVYQSLHIGNPHRAPNSLPRGRATYI